MAPARLLVQWQHVDIISRNQLAIDIFKEGMKSLLSLCSADVCYFLCFDIYTKLLPQYACQMPLFLTRNAGLMQSCHLQFCHRLNCAVIG